MENAIQNAKDELQVIMSHKILILRDILSTLRHEQSALLSDNHSILKSIVENRFVLIETFDEWNVRFFPLLQQLERLLKGSNKRELDETFSDHLKKLIDYLNEEDFELLLLREQIIEVLEEIRQQTTATLYYLENKPSINENQNYSAHLHHNFLKFSVKEIPQKKAIVGLIDSEQKDPQ